MLATLVIITTALVAYANGANANFKGVASLYGSGTTGFGLDPVGRIQNDADVVRSYLAMCMGGQRNLNFCRTHQWMLELPRAGHGVIRDRTLKRADVIHQTK